MKRICELLENKGDNYILPFFWQHGEEESVLREYMGAIHSCGIGAVCVEARPHPDFAGPKWWNDMDIIMDEARRRGMRVWLLDDAHFPTGFANGALENADPKLCKQYLSVNSTDVCGPMPQAEVNVAGMAKTFTFNFGGGANGIYSQLLGRRAPNKRTFDDDEMLCVIASKLVEGSAVDDTLLDLTSLVVDGVLEWDVPDGMWRVFVIYKTRNGGGRSDYINIIDKDSCRVQIDAVYEPHYERYKEDFGKTFAGFFSDEPLFGNTEGFNFDEIIGRKKMPLPWSKDVPGMLEERLGEDWKRMLPALWTDAGNSGFTAKIRYAYMDTVTRLVEESFSNQIGKWCEDHGVEYIGHVIEDNNQHARLGSSLGHYFRSLAGQHMSGIDDIGNQVLLGGENHTRISMFTREGDGEFYHFALGKLGSSLAHIDPKKKGRAMCEIFGAYGWGEGVRLMKWLADHFLVRGVNYYVPHAFSPKEFPDIDCPPHFYAHGLNPQFRHFQYLMRYMNRMCHIFNGGKHIAPAAVLYHGEAEWTGKCMFLQKPARELLEHQIDFDILPSDLFADMDGFNANFDGLLHVNGECYRTLIIPYAEFISEAVARFATMAASKGFKVIFINDLPCGIYNSSGTEHVNTSNLIEELRKCSVVQLEELSSHLTASGIFDIQLSKPFKRLRYYHYFADNQDVYMFSNEHPGQTFEGNVTVSSKGPAFLYDAMENTVRPISAEPCESGTELCLRLEPYQSKVVIFGDTPAELVAEPMAEGEKYALDGEWKLSFAKAKEYPDFSNAETISRLENIGKKNPAFSGFMRYEKTFLLDTPKEAVLDIEDAYEGVEVWVNDKYAGMRICPPYRFDISEMVTAGENSLRIEVANTLERAVSGMGTGMFSMSGLSTLKTPIGIVGSVSIYLK